MGPLIGNTGLNLTVLSYDGELNVGVIACPELIDDVGELANGFVEAVADLLAAATAVAAAPSSATASVPSAGPVDSKAAKGSKEKDSKPAKGSKKKGSKKKGSKEKGSV
jgi:hypothetical protein